MPSSLRSGDPAQPAPPAGPFTLARAIARAIEANPDVSMAERRLEQAQAGTSEATAGFLPSLDARVGWSRTDDPLVAFGMLLRQRKFSSSLDPNHPGDQQDVRPDVVFAWNIFRGGADLERRQGALANEEASAQEIRATRNALANATAEAFFGLSKAQDLIPVAEESLKAVDAALEDARAREAVGKVLAGDVLSLEARRAEAKDVLVRARNGVAVGRAVLRSLLALPGDVPLEILPDMESPAREPISETAAIAKALEQRPELKATQARIGALDHEVTATSREANPFIPRVDAYAAYGVDSSNLRFSGKADNWTVGVAADWNLFAGGRDRARARRAEAQLAEAREGERKLVLGIELEVRRARLAVEEARERIETADGGVKSADEAHRVVKEQYAAGAISVTRYLEAEVARRDGRARAIVARADLRISQAAFAKALGELERGEEKP